MSLLNLLMAAGGEKGRGAFWRWCVAMSQAIGTATEPPEYAYSKHTGAQAGITTNTNLIIADNGLMRGITRPGGSQTVWQLTPGKTYALVGFGTFDTFSDATGGVLRIDWVDDTNTRLNSGNIDFAPGSFYPTSNTAAQSSMSYVSGIYQAGSGALALVKLRCTAATGTAALSAGNFAVTIQEIPG
jgi:hypothetical protein